MLKKLLAICLCLSLFACSDVRDDIPVQILSERLLENINGSENMSEASTDYIKYCMESDLGIYSEYIVLYPFAGKIYNEIGIFKVRDEKDVEKAVSEVKSYITFKTENWDTRYMGEEFEKIKNSEIVPLGKYVLYTILSENEQKKVVEEYKKQLS